MGLFGLGNLVHIPPNPKNGSQGFRALFRTFLVIFLNRWSDKRVQKIKKFGKGHISIPRTKGFDVAF